MQASFLIFRMFFAFLATSIARCSHLICLVTEMIHLILFFSAGVWGYEEWRKTFQFLNQRTEAAPVIITAYTLEECQEDYEVIESAVSSTDSVSSSGRCLWGPDLNKFGSNAVRETTSSLQEYRENAAWQAWLLGGT